MGINEKVGGIRCELAIGDGWGALSRRNRFMSEMGQSRHSDCVSITSGLPRKADKFKAGPDFAKVPGADSGTAVNDVDKLDALFDHLVDAREQHRRHGEAERTARGS